MEKYIFISVIVPSNAEQYLKTCLDSLISQTYTNFEVLCVDDGSTDHSLDILRFYEKKDNRIKVFIQEMQDLQLRGIKHYNMRVVIILVL